jgi:hypothetical protein
MCAPCAVDAVTARARTSSHLKWLINERAALAGALQSLHAREARAHEELRTVRRERQFCEERLAALERVLGLLTQGAALCAPVTVNATQGTYGERGALRRFLLDSLEASAPEPLDTFALTKLVIGHFGLPVTTGRARKAFADNKLRPALRRLRAQGLIEPVERRSVAGAGRVGWWRRTPPQATLGALVA